MKLIDLDQFKEKRKTMFPKDIFPERIQDAFDECDEEQSGKISERLASLFLKQYAELSLVHYCADSHLCPQKCQIKGICNIVLERKFEKKVFAFVSIKSYLRFLDVLGVRWKTWHI